MQTPRTLRRNESGSVLLMSLIISAIVGVTLASYLVMTESQNVSVARSQTWNSSMVLTEAGLEDGLAMINKYNGSIGLLETWTNNVGVDNYTALGNDVYYVRRTVSTNGYGSNYYDVYITNKNNSPIVAATGYAAWKHSYASLSPMNYFAAVNQTQPTSKAPPARKIAVKTSKDALFAVAMAAINSIDLKGNNITTDSFDSDSSSSNNINGLYPAGNLSLIKSNGDICTDAQIVNSISVGNANIKGKARTGAAGTVSVGPNGYVSGGIFNDFNVLFPAVTLPTMSLQSPAGSTTVNGKTYTKAILYSGDYLLAGLSGSLYIATNISVRILVTASVNLTGNSDEIRIGKNSYVSMYMNAPTFSIKGNGIVNDNGNAGSFYYFGTSANTSVTFGGNGGFTGAIYAPNADFSLGGGGNNTIDFIGASVTKSVSMNGHFNFHYDENLRRIGPGRGYIPVNWSEVAASN